MKIKEIKERQAVLEDEIRALPKAKIVIQCSSLNNNGDYIDVDNWKSDSMFIYDHHPSNHEMEIESDTLKEALALVSFYQCPIYRFNQMNKYDDIVWAATNFQKIEAHPESEKLWKLIESLDETNFELVKQILSSEK
jgi:hypothetical protein